jgi:hypothetical protein
VPLGLVLGEYSDHQWKWPVVVVLEGLYFVNSAGLFMLGNILEKQPEGKKEFTTVKMPRSLVEGAETLVAYQLFFLFPHYNTELMALFGLAIVATILQRVHWAYHNLK